ncbi:MAG TPA: ribose 5-phosphate isomerase B [Pyrinomonadaceae bacterium]|nr:ribose 5-phosphate isomerase B [Pyrinomonadaceae bacterium]
MAEDQSSRDRIRALVREVLDKAQPGESGDQGDAAPASHFIDVARVRVPPSVTPTRDESAKTIITEDDIRDLEQGATLRVAEGARLTPLAADIVHERRIELVRRVPRHRQTNAKMIALGCDHGGFKMKEDLKSFLASLSVRVYDFGTDSEEAVDYPDFAHAVARAVAEGAADLGIIIDGAGVGSAITANKVPGVRAAACYSVAVARNSREHNDANVLTLGSKTISSKEMREIVEAWLTTELTEERHRKRVAKIAAVERQYQHR